MTAVGFEPTPFRLAPEVSPLDHSAKLSCLARSQGICFHYLLCLRVSENNSVAARIATKDIPCPRRQRGGIEHLHDSMPLDLKSSPSTSLSHRLA